MKGIVFSEFLEFVEQRFSPDTADDIIDAADLPSGGAYTAVGTYEHQEMLQLVSELSRATDTPAADLLLAFGHYLFGRLAATYPVFLEGTDDAFSFLQSVEKHIHVEVRKLYPDAELPQFDDAVPSPGSLELLYSSKRPLGDLAEGLIRGCCDHFGTSVEIAREDLPAETGSAVRFILTRRD